MKNHFAEGYNAMSDAEKKIFRRKVYDTCGWSYATFYNKMRNPGSIRVLEKKSLARLLNIPVAQL